MRAKQWSWLIAALLFVLACSLVQSRPLAPTTTEPAVAYETPTTPASGGASATPAAAEATPTATTPAVVYELFDESPAPDQFTVVRVGKTKEARPDILRVEAKKAADMGRHPFVEFYAEWCPPCKAIEANLGDQRMVDAFSGTYIIRLDLDYWQQKLSHTGFYVPGIPAFYEIDTDGKPTGRMITGAAWGEDVPANIAPPMKRFFNGG